MNCPHCDCSLTISETEGHVGFVCKSCKGLWLPRKYVDSLKYSYTFSVESFFASLSNGKAVTSSGRQCPMCKAPLTRSAVKETELDWCQKCQGVWFDKSELTKLVTFEHQMTPAQQTVWDSAQIVEGVGHILSLISSD